MLHIMCMGKLKESVDLNKKNTPGAKSKSAAPFHFLVPQLYVGLQFTFYILYLIYLTSYIIISCSHYTPGSET